TRNAQDGISVVQTAEGALTEVHSMLNRMRDLAVQSANTGSMDADAIAAAQAEVDELVFEIDRVATTTKFGQTNLLDGDFDGNFQIGANSGEVLNVTIGNMDVGTGGLQIGSATGTVAGGNRAVVSDVLDLSGDAAGALDAIDAAISTVSAERGTLGATQNRFESTINNLQVTTENLAASESRIRDTDMALEMVSFTRHQILTQAGTAMLGQANQLPQGVLRLLG
ncbi:MAG: flagellin, partial [Acidimicrobiales bacterium]